MKFEKYATSTLLFLWVVFQLYAARFMVKGVLQMKKQREQNSLLSENHSKVRKASLAIIQSASAVQDDDRGAISAITPGSSDETAKDKLQRVAKGIGEVAVYQQRVLDEACVGSATTTTRTEQTAGRLNQNASAGLP